jgi:hypothetical protein
MTNPLRKLMEIEMQTAGFQTNIPFQCDIALAGAFNDCD